MKNSHKDVCLFYGINEKQLFKINRELLYSYWEKFYDGNLETYNNILANKQELKLPLINPNFEEKIVITILSIFGWKLHQQKDENNDNNNYLFCKFCGRKFLISHFNCKPEIMQNLDENKSLLTQENNIFFDVLEGHRSFCKWGNIDTTTRKIKKIYGWNICLNFLFENKHKKEHQKSTFDKMNEISKIKIQLINSIDEYKKKKEVLFENEEINKKIIGISSEYELGESDLLKEKIQQNRQELEEIYNDLGEKMNEPIKKLKIT